MKSIILLSSRSRFNIIYHCAWLILIADDCNVTPLLAAAYKNNIDCARALVKANCKLNVVGELKINHVHTNVSPLQCSIIMGHLEISRLLILAGTGFSSFEFLLKQYYRDLMMMM